MQIVKKYDLSDFEAWSGATTLWDIIQAAGKVDALEYYLDGIRDNGEIDETELNDMLWYEGDIICNVLWERDEDYILSHEEQIRNGEEPDDIDAGEEDE